MSSGEALAVTLLVARTLESLEIPYLVAGSLASSLHGLPRSTEDADLVVDLALEQAESLVASLEGVFYVDTDSVHEAIRLRSSFNVIHLSTMFKVDLFVAGDDSVARQELERRQTFVVDEESSETLTVASAEDTVVQKLYWYRLRHGVSDRQWRDACGVLKVNRGGLDLTYMKKTADALGVADLLEKALGESA